jgi:hypothetical protein
VGVLYCTRIHNQWQRFGLDVDDVVPLASRFHPASLSDVSDPVVRLVTVGQEPGSFEDDISLLDRINGKDSGSTEVSWLEGLSEGELRNAQLHDLNLKPIIHWVKNKVDPPEHELYLASRETKLLWPCRKPLVIKNRILFY